MNKQEGQVAQQQQQPGRALGLLLELVEPKEASIKQPPLLVVCLRLQLPRPQQVASSSKHSSNSKVSRPCLSSSKSRCISSSSMAAVNRLGEMLWLALLTPLRLAVSQNSATGCSGMTGQRDRMRDMGTGQLGRMQQRDRM